MSTTSSIDDYAAIAARLNEIEGKQVYDPMTDRMVRPGPPANGLGQQAMADPSHNHGCAAGGAPPLGMGAMVKVACPMCMDTGWVRRDSGYRIVEEQCPRCFNPRGYPPPGCRP